MSIEIGWPSIAASASIPPTPQPTTPRPLTIVVCESVPTSVSGYASVPPVGLFPEDDAREVLEIDLVNDAGVGRHDAEVLERVLAPAKERVALPVARELERGVEVGGVRLGVVIDLNRMVDDELDRLQRVDFSRIAAEPNDAVAHGREIDDRRHAGEVLQQDARGREGDLLLHFGGHVPARQRLDVLGIDEPRVLAAQQVLEEDLERERQPCDDGKPAFSSAGRLKMSKVSPPAVSGVRVPNELLEPIL